MVEQRTALLLWARLKAAKVSIREYCRENGVARASLYRRKARACREIYRGLQVDYAAGLGRVTKTFTSQMA